MVKMGGSKRVTRCKKWGFLGFRGVDFRSKRAVLPPLRPWFWHLTCADFRKQTAYSRGNDLGRMGTPKKGSKWSKWGGQKGSPDVKNGGFWVLGRSILGPKGLFYPPSDPVFGDLRVQILENRQRTRGVTIWVGWVPPKRAQNGQNG